MKKPKKARAPKKRSTPTWELRLYVADTMPRSVLARENLEAFCQDHLPGGYRVTIIDIVKQPASTRRDGIVATPTLTRLRPGPPRRLVGTLGRHRTSAARHGKHQLYRRCSFLDDASRPRLKKRMGEIR